MINCRRLFGLIFSLLIVLTSATNAQWRLDGDDRLRNFRMDEQINASASAQPTRVSLEELRSKLPRGFSVYVVDLRQESHGFANDVPVSWYSEHNAANAELDSDAILSDEIERLQSIVGKRVEFVPLGKSDTQMFKPLKIKVKRIATEREIVENFGWRYMRFTDADMTAPDLRLVNEFVHFVKALPEDAWLHFHCQAGMGRGTLFMVLYDIILHPEKPLEEIVQRQFEIGGMNLFAENNGDDWYAQRHRERAATIREFYRIAHSGQLAEWSASFDRQVELQIAPAFELPLASIDVSNKDVTILGEPRATQAQMIRLINLRNPTPKLNCSVEEIVATYYAEAGREGIRADIALCQALKETGTFNYGGDVDPKQNNYCGLGATGNHVKGAAFDSPQLGARAHIQHLLAYATTRRPSVAIIDPRYEIAAAARSVKINNWLGLGGTWAVPGTYYGQDILNIWRQALVPDGSAQSIADAERRVKDSPNDAAAYINRAIAYFNAGQYSRAIADYDAALKIKPSVEGCYDRALAHEMMNDYARAIADYSEAIALDELFPQAWYNRGRAHLLANQYDEAIADFNHSLELVPQLANAKNNIAVIHARQHKFEQAADDIKDAARINSTNEVVNANLELMKEWQSGEPELKSIVDKPISWTPKREQLTREYALKHYGTAWTEIEPQVVVVHWTASNDAQGVFKYFDAESDADGELQVASHFLVDRDGTIYRLTPETRLNRHAIGYNWCAIGIENVGGVNGREDLTAEQLQANVELIRYLHKKFPSIKYVFGHYQQVAARQTGLYLERVPNYFAKKPDPGAKFMRGLRARLSGDGLNFFDPEAK